MELMLYPKKFIISVLLSISLVLALTPVHPPDRSPPTNYNSIKTMIFWHHLVPNHPPVTKPSSAQSSKFFSIRVISENWLSCRQTLFTWSGLVWSGPIYGRMEDGWPWTLLNRYFGTGAGAGCPQSFRCKSEKGNKIYC